MTTSFQRFSHTVGIASTFLINYLPVQGTVGGTKPDRLALVTLNTLLHLPTKEAARRRRLRLLRLRRGN